MIACINYNVKCPYLNFFLEKGIVFYIMKDHELVHFYPSPQIFDQAAKIFDRERKALAQLFPYADIQHVGSCAIPGALGKFDIDIQIRIPRQFFEKVIEEMEKYYVPKHRDILWNNNWAIFRADDFTKDDIDYLITVIDAPEDDFYKVRDYLINHPEVLEEYNNLKLRYEGHPYGEYRKAKQNFLGGNGSVRFLSED